jgi:predicted dehydrogenase
MTTTLSRRRFVRAAGLAAASLGPALQAAGTAPASGRVRIGLIGCGGRGRELVRVFQEFPDVEFVAVSDFNEPRMRQAANAIARGPQGRAPEQVLDHQRLLERKDVDAVLIATTQHWHGLPFIHATQAGKHVYVEKPFSHTVVEGRAMVAAAKKAGVLAMMGSQQRGGMMTNWAIHQSAATWRTSRT